MQQLDQCSLAQYEAFIASQEADFDFCLRRFELSRGEFTAETTRTEMDADWAEMNIRQAKKKIRELMAEIDRQEAIIRGERRVIAKASKIASQSPRKQGRPSIASGSNKQWRQAIAKKFVAQWVESLMSALSVQSCDELARVAGGNKMTWWRWKSQEALPTLRRLEPLLDATIKSGELQGTALRDIQTTPHLSRLIALLELT